MEVSHFELLFKPQSPVPPADVVLQGYFLSITNLEDTSLSFRVDFVTTSVAAPTRTLAGNTLAIVDIAGVNNDFTYTLSGSSSAKSFRLTPLVAIPPHATALLVLLPRDPFPAPIGDGTADPADYEARGYVTLRLPALLRRFDGGFGLLRFVSQLDRPARVLLTPQNRATYFRDGVITSQTQASLPLASGTALVEVAAERGFFFPPIRIGDIGDLPSLPNRVDLDRLPVELAERLAIAAASDVDFGEFNRVLEQAGIDIALQRRGERSDDAS